MAITKYSVRRPSYRNWADMEDVQNRLSRFFDDTFLPFQGREGSWMPAVTVSETKEALLLTAELPGLVEDDISIELENNVLTIAGEKVETREETDEERKFHVYERGFGAFSRSFTLPRTVDGQNIVATFDNGVLSVRLPKVAEAKGRRIEISK